MDMRVSERRSCSRRDMLCAPSVSRSLRSSSASRTQHLICVRRIWSCLASSVVRFDRAPRRCVPIGRRALDMRNARTMRMRHLSRRPCIQGRVSDCKAHSVSIVFRTFLPFLCVSPRPLLSAPLPSCLSSSARVPSSIPPAKHRTSASPARAVRLPLVSLRFSTIASSSRLSPPPLSIPLPSPSPSPRPP